MKKTGLTGYVYEFIVDYADLNKSNPNKVIPLIHNYFMLKYSIK